MPLVEEMIDPLWPEGWKAAMRACAERWPHMTPLRYVPAGETVWVVGWAMLVNGEMEIFVSSVRPSNLTTEEEVKATIRPARERHLNTLVASGEVVRGELEPWR